MKTRIMNAKKGAGVQYKNVFDCFIQTFKNEVKKKKREIYFCFLGSTCFLQWIHSKCK